VEAAPRPDLSTDATDQQALRFKDPSDALICDDKSGFPSAPCRVQGRYFDAGIVARTNQAVTVTYQNYSRKVKCNSNDPDAASVTPVNDGPDPTITGYLVSFRADCGKSHSGPYNALSVYVHFTYTTGSYYYNLPISGNSFTPSPAYVAAGLNEIANRGIVECKLKDLVSLASTLADGASIALEGAAALKEVLASQAVEKLVEKTTESVGLNSCAVARHLEGAIAVIDQERLAGLEKSRTTLKIRDGFSRVGKTSTWAVWVEDVTTETSSSLDSEAWRQIISQTTGGGASNGDQILSERATTFAPLPRLAWPPSAAAPGMPSNLTLTFSNGTLVANWNPPVSDGGSPVQGYSLFLSTPTADLVPIELPATTTTYTFPNITQAGSYTVYVAAINSIGPGLQAMASATVGGSEASYQSAVLSDHPVAFWPLNDPAGTTSVRDATGGPAGTTECGASLGVASGPIPGTTALRLDGSPCSDVNVGSDYTALTQVTGAMTIEIWARTDAVNQDVTIPYLMEVGQWNNLGYGLEWNGSAMGADFGQGFIGGGWNTPGVGVWHQLAFTYDPATGVYCAYADGVQQFTQTIGPLDPNMFDAAGGALIGRRARNVSGDGYAPFTGDVANVSVYDHVLSTEQIAAHYAAAGGH